MIPPLKGRITGKFGPRIHPISGVTGFHNGVDIAAPLGTKIVAPADATVTQIWDDPKGGKSLAIETKTGMRFGFAHLSKRLVDHVGQSVSINEAIAEVGSTGKSTGPHLHFTVRVGGVQVDPMKYFTFI